MSILAAAAASGLLSSHTHDREAAAPFRNQEYPQATGATSGHTPIDCCRTSPRRGRPPLFYASVMGDLPWPATAIGRAAELAGPSASVRAVRVLAGGTHARTCLIKTANPQLEVVLRQFPPGDDAVSRETDILTALGGLGGLAPRLLASALDDGSREGSWVLISRLPGAADITPARPSAAAAQLGRALARIHATSLHHCTGLQSVLGRPGGSAAAISGPAASAVAARWDLLARAPGVLTHYDFWSGNVVWDGGILTGVVDWTGAGLGPRGFDVGWCRLDLYLLHGEHVAGTFLDSYEAASGSGLASRLLADLWAVARSHDHVETWVPNYRDLGRADLTARKLRRRHTAWTEQLLASQL
jgi:aminoglycoside phosphotransferase (APT) family kinase protein